MEHRDCRIEKNIRKTKVARKETRDLSDATEGGSIMIIDAYTEFVVSSDLTCISLSLLFPAALVTRDNTVTQKRETPLKRRDEGDCYRIHRSLMEY